jgi:AraC-like DNA-binding protein
MARRFARSIECEMRYSLGMASFGPCQPSEVDGHASGYYVSSRSFAFGVTMHGLAATLVWGVCDANTALELGEVWEPTLDGPPRDTLIDVTHLTLVDGAAFAMFRDALEARREVRARVVRRQAIVSSGDFGAVFIRGYLAMFPPPYPVREVATVAEGLAWLGHECCGAELAELDACRVDELARLRAWLDHAPLEHPTIELAAASLAVTPRTLQRRLASAGTRFASELARARVSRARSLMRDPMRKLSEVALEVGCATPSAFSDLYRRVTGESPSEWRRRFC